MRARVGSSTQWTKYCANRFKASPAAGSENVATTDKGQASNRYVRNATAADAVESAPEANAYALEDERDVPLAVADMSWKNDEVASSSKPMSQEPASLRKDGEIAFWRAHESADLFLSPSDNSPVSGVGAGSCVKSTGSTFGPLMQVKRTSGDGIVQTFWTRKSAYRLAQNGTDNHSCFAKVDDDSINLPRD